MSIQTVTLTIEVDALGGIKYKSTIPMNNYQRWQFLQNAANAQLLAIMAEKEDKRILTPTGTV